MANICKNNDQMIYEMDHIWTADMKSSEAMILTVVNAIFANCVKKPEKFRTSTGFWTCDLAISVRRSNQLNYEATDVGMVICGFQCSHEQWTTMKWYMKWITYELRIWFHLICKNVTLPHIGKNCSLGLEILDTTRTSGPVNNIITLIISVTFLSFQSTIWLA